jgi:hypothetical protein
MAPKAPCKGCEDREIGCHDRCEKYQEYRQQNIEHNVMVANARRVDSYFNAKAKENADRGRRNKK